MSIKKRIERIEAILDARGLDWDHPRVEEEPAKEPPKKWRILEPGEVVCSSDRVKAKTSPPSDPPDGLGWRPVDASVGTSVCEDDPCVFARPVADDPAKQPEPEHPPDPGEGYRILSKDPPEELAEGDDFWFSSYSEWHKSFHATLGITSQCDRLWFRRKIEQPKAPQPEYREPVLPADVGQPCEFSMTEKDWYPSLLSGFQVHNNPWISSDQGRWNFARIKKGA